MAIRILVVARMYGQMMGIVSILDSAFVPVVDVHKPTGEELTGMRVLMLGWEFPPFKTGGLGTACYGLTRGLKHMGVEVTFVAPVSRCIGIPDHVKFVGTPDVHAKPEKTMIHPVITKVHTAITSVENHRVSPVETDHYTQIRLVRVNVPLSPYERPEQYFEVRRIRNPVRDKMDVKSNTSYKEQYHRVSRASDPNEQNAVMTDDSHGKVAENKDLYGQDLFENIEKYAFKVQIIAKREKFDIIHAHDWMTFRAGIEARKVSGKPLVMHVHSTERDRTGGQGCNPMVCDIERKMTSEADGVIAVSNRTKKAIMENYGVPAENIDVVYNAIDITDSGILPVRRLRKKIVLFLGRMTIQKGPDYFLEAAARVLEKEPDVMFVMVGGGDMMHKIIERAADLKIGHKVLFPGFLKGPAVDAIYEMADVYVMPSVSEPFGITPLEAMSHSVPVIISKQSGVSEVIKNALKVDFWNIDALTSKITELLRYRTLHDLLGKNGKAEIQSFSWDNSASQCINVYDKIIKGKLSIREFPPPLPGTHKLQESPAVMPSSISL